MKNKFIDLTGEKFGRWTVLERAENIRSSAGWKCICECGTIRLVIGYCLRSGHSKSCGCYTKEMLSKSRKTHGFSRKLTEYRIWSHMIGRCTNVNDQVYHYYGGRGISICDRWRNNFILFLEDMGPRPSNKHSLDRIDVDGNYEPSNCKWSTHSEQVYNQRIKITNTSGYKGVYKHSGGKWGSQIGVNKQQINLGYFNTMEEAVNARKEAEIKYYG